MSKTKEFEIIGVHLAHVRHHVDDEGVFGEVIDTRPAEGFSPEDATYYSVEDKDGTIHASFDDFEEAKQWIKENEED